MSFDDVEVAGQARVLARTDTAAYAPAKVQASRPDENAPVIVRQGSFVAPSRRLAFVAPYPCMVTSVGMVTSSQIPKALSNRWEVVFRKTGADYLSSWYRDDVMSRSPKRYYRMDDNTGAAAAHDETGTADLAYAGSPTMLARGLPGAGVEAAVYFDGTGNQYARASAAADPALGASQLTLEMVFAPDGSLLAGRQDLMGHDAATGTGAAASQPRLVLTPGDDGRPNGLAVCIGASTFIVASKNCFGWRPGDRNLVTYVRDLITPVYAATLHASTALPAGTIVTDTTPGSGVPASTGTIYVGGQAVAYTGTARNTNGGIGPYVDTFTGCTGGAGTIAAGAAVTQQIPDALYLNGVSLPVVYPNSTTYVDEAYFLILGKGRHSGGTPYPFAGVIDEFFFSSQPATLADHQHRYGVIATLSNKADDIDAFTPWLARGAYDSRHRFLNTGECVWFEPNPMNDVAPLLDVSTIVNYQAV